ncbi:MAG TPA: M48 family metallopeptidase [Candidatus Melainabacteria bacterium]|nr:M48 family metallopeptidase [Candidatus Melainabacteria bacterium]
MANKSRTSRSNPIAQDSVNSQRALNEMYQHFMAGYVRRINEATLNVTIGGGRIGSAKYTRLAQINLKSRIITFSRHAIENVPERGRRYLVLHELSHVLEASHNRKFWSHVERYEPEYQKIGKELDRAFKLNVRADMQTRAAEDLLSGKTRQEKLEQLKGIATPRLMGGLLQGKQKVLDIADESVLITGKAALSQFEADEDNDSYICMEDEFGMYDDGGIISGGSAFGGNYDEIDESDFE